MECAFMLKRMVCAQGRKKCEKQIYIRNTQNYKIHRITKYQNLHNWFWISDVSESFCRVRVTSPSSQSRLRVIQNFIVSSQSQSHDLVESEQSHEDCRVTSSHWFASQSQCRVTLKFHVFSTTFFCQEMTLDNYKMVPNML